MKKAEKGTNARRQQIENEIFNLRRALDYTTELQAKFDISTKIQRLETELEDYYYDD